MSVASYHSRSKVAPDIGTYTGTGYFFGEIQVGQAVNISPVLTPNRGRLPVEFTNAALFDNSAPAGLTINTSNGVASGTPTGANGSSYFSETFFFPSVAYRGADGRAGTTLQLGMTVFSAAALQLTPGTVTSLTGTSGGRGLQIIGGRTGTQERAIERINNNGASFYSTYFGPVRNFGTYPPSSDYEVRATLVSGTPDTTNGNTFGVWHGLNTTRAFLSTGGPIEFDLEFRPVGGGSGILNFWSFT